MRQKSKKKFRLFRKKRCCNSAFFLLHLKTLSIWVIHNSFFNILLIVWSWNWNNFWNHQNCCFLLLLFSIWFAHLITIGLLLFAFLYWHKFCAESKLLSGNLSQKRENIEPIPFPLQKLLWNFLEKMKLTKFTFFISLLSDGFVLPY